MIDTQLFGLFGLMMLMFGRYFSLIVARQILGFISFALFVGYNCFVVGLGDTNLSNPIFTLGVDVWSTISHTIHFRDHPELRVKLEKLWPGIFRFISKSFMKQIKLY